MTLKNSINKTLAGTLCLASLFAFPSAFAGDIAYELRNNKQVENYFELGLGAHSYSGPSRTESNGNESGFHGVINGSYNWNGFFVDSYNESTDPFLLGYNAWQGDNWSFDLTLGIENDGFDGSDDERFIGLEERDTDVMLGGRLLGRFGANIVQFNVKRDISGSHQGHSLSAQFGRNWQYNDWNFHALVGLHYADTTLNNYYNGITELEAQRTGFDSWDAGDSLAVNAEIGVTYPVNENWEFRATAQYVALDDDTTNSPIFLDNSDYVSGIRTSLSYKF